MELNTEKALKYIQMSHLKALIDTPLSEQLDEWKNARDFIRILIMKEQLGTMKEFIND